MTMGNLCWFLAAFALAMTISLVRGKKCICTFGKQWDHGDLANCGMKNLSEIPECVTSREQQLITL